MDEALPFGLTSGDRNGLPPRQLSFVDDLHRLLAGRGLAPDAADVEGTTVLLEVTTPTSPEAGLLITIDPDEVVVSSAFDHWHHSRDDVADGRLHPWSGGDGMEVALRFIEALLDGSIEVEVRYGLLGTKATTWWQDGSGRYHVVQRSRTLLPPFRRGTERRRLTFDGPG